MKKRILTLVSCLFMVCVTQANQTTSNHFYLKIKLTESEEINYPPGTGFVAEDAQGNTLLNPSVLETLGSFKVTEPITLWVFTTWNDEPDVFEMDKGELISVRTAKEYNPDTTYIYNQRKEKNFVPKGEVNEYGGWSGSSNGVALMKERYFDYDKETGYDASLEFSDGTIFYYSDGKVEAWQNGKTLPITGNHLIETAEGVIKLRYLPKTKKIWWVFEKN